MPRSLQGRLLLLVLGLVVAAWTATALLIWHGARAQLDALLDGHLAQAAALLVVQQGNEIGDQDFDLDAPALHQMAPKVAFQVFHEGELVMRSAKAPQQPFLPPAEAGVTGFHDVTLGGLGWRVFAAHGSEHELQVYVAERSDSRQAILLAVLRGMLWPALAAIPLLALAMVWSVNHSVEPLRHLGRLLAARRAQAEEALVVPGAPSELAPTLLALNGLFQRTATLLSAERRFTADAAHELRTPIAAIRAQAQAALGENDQTLRHHALDATVEGCDRAAHLVEQLLTLSRLEAEVLPAPQPVDLVSLVRRVLAGIAPDALRKDQQIEFDACERAAVGGDPTLLGILVRNLTDNAIRYSPAGATVRVQLVAERERVCLRVEDSGPGMREEQRLRLGERFFRVLGSGQEGSGLGWSIVKRVVAAHGARITIGRAQGLGGLCVDVEFKAIDG